MVSQVLQEQVVVEVAEADRFLLPQWVVEEDQEQ
jgi:hypothetical protein